MELFIKPKTQLDQKVDWKLSKKTKLILSYYAEYSGYTENEVADMFLRNLMKDVAFEKWLSTKRSKKRIEALMSEENDTPMFDEGENNV